MTNLQLHFRGGSKRAANLKPTESFQAKIKPNGESDLTIEFVDVSGKQHSTNLDVYLEPSFRGRIEVTIERDGKVSAKDELKIGM